MSPFGICQSNPSVLRATPSASMPLPTKNRGKITCHFMYFLTQLITLQQHKLEAPYCQIYINSLPWYQKTNQTLYCNCQFYAQSKTLQMQRYCLKAILHIKDTKSDKLWQNSMTELWCTRLHTHLLCWGTVPATPKESSFLTILQLLSKLKIWISCTGNV